MVITLETPVRIGETVRDEHHIKYQVETFYVGKKGIHRIFATNREGDYPINLNFRPKDVGVTVFRVTDAEE